MEIRVHNYILLIALFLVSVLHSCSSKGDGDKLVTPWGEVESDTVSADGICSVEDIVGNGELIVVTMSGPDTYFEYHGRGIGTQYFLCEKFAQHLGVALRVEVCRDTTEMVEKLRDGSADILMFMLPEQLLAKNGLQPTRVVSADSTLHWSVAKGNTSLSGALDDWYKPGMLAEVKKQERFLLSSRSVKRHVYAPFLNKEGGVISKYDNLFRRYAPVARWDWRLLAAQCYQESCFDPNARSWAGACGLMQIMPSTADHLGLARSEMNNPEKSVEAACRLLAELSGQFRDVRSAEDRQCFVLAAYNGGGFHIRDAMALARKYGGNSQRWADVAPYILRLQQPEYYNDPVVRYGYMRGSETVDYVDRIRKRYAQYRGCKYTGPSVGNQEDDIWSGGMATPRRATKKYKYHI